MKISNATIDDIATGTVVEGALGEGLEDAGTSGGDGWSGFIMIPGYGQQGEEKQPGSERDVTDGASEESLLSLARRGVGSYLADIAAMASSSLTAAPQNRGWTRAPFLAAYLLHGLLHELSHAAFASLLLPNNQPWSWAGTVRFVARAALGRYCLVELGDGVADSFSVAAVRHAGWIFSLVLAVGLHYLHRACGCSTSNKHSSTWQPAVVLAAYVTALEAMSTDLLGLVPAFGQATGSSALRLYCGNFGIILLNSAWLNVDGGKTALDMLQKMVEVTMMRGAQSGGVVTYEPDKNYSKYQAPSIRGVRSRVVNAKRTVLSEGVRAKIEKDNGKKLRGWKGDVYNGDGTGRRLVRAFFGHTRFATSSKATFDGTHPHQWSPRRVYTVYPFASGAASGGDRQRRGTTVFGRQSQIGALSREKSGIAATRKLKPISQKMGVEIYITHNGDFEYFNISGKYYDTGAIQDFLVRTLRVPMPATVDSAAVAGMMDLHRCQGCFTLAARYALCFKMGGGSKDVKPTDTKFKYPKIKDYEQIAKVFEQCLDEFVQEEVLESLEDISSDEEMRELLGNKIKKVFADGEGPKSAIDKLSDFVSFDIEDGDLGQFVNATVNAFFDNDLLHSVRTFLDNAKGSFGLSVSTSMDAHRQVCFAAKGQTLSVAFYPRKGVICFGSEQAAVKAGLNYDIPQGKQKGDLSRPLLGHGGYQYVDEDAVRLDLDDLAGEVALLDWGFDGDNEPAVSPPNRDLVVDRLMGGAINVVLRHQERGIGQNKKRLVHLENNEFIKPLLDDMDDPVLGDIMDIPRICKNIQDDWQGVGLNRMTVWHLCQCIKARMRARADKTIDTQTNTVDILVTGCEVSLWVGEQFVSDLQKCFPKLGIKAVSSNKLLGLFGQELPMPAIGFPYTEKCLDMKDPIVIIVSHSGGTFGPLACSNLMQSFSSSIFAVTSEWDTQVGKQLRSMYGGDKNDLLTSRIFSTDVGVRPAEPCSVSVVATHQLLTQIFEHISLTIISDPRYRCVSGAIINERDLQTLERCNQGNIKSLKRIVGVSAKHTEAELRAAGDIWSEHILEGAKAYIMSFIYIVVTVTIGYPLITGIATAAGFDNSTPAGERLIYLLRFFDGLLYFWIPQVNIFIIRIFQRRNLRHRMVGRTVVIGDPCPWVAQSAEAFLSKIFACSYSIAGLGVLSGNPADHLVHRHTHRVVRGSLLVCGRPDGRLTALTTEEASTCLAVNQASSIQSIGGTCESITIGHNRSKLPLSYKGIFLETDRPQFLCEKLLDDANKGKSQGGGQSAAGLLGEYSNMERDAKAKTHIGEHHLDEVIDDMINKKKRKDSAVDLFHQMDTDGNGVISFQEFADAYQQINPNVCMKQLKHMFSEADENSNGTIEMKEFLNMTFMSNVDVLGKMSIKNRDGRNLVQVMPSEEEYFGEELENSAPPGVGAFSMSQSQHLSMELYESRVASMQRFVAMCVMFHQMGHRVQSFFPRISFGYWGYRMDRTHSIMRIATTASPVSGADVREQMLQLRLQQSVRRAIKSISESYANWKSD